MSFNENKASKKPSFISWTIVFVLGLLVGIQIERHSNFGTDFKLFPKSKEEISRIYQETLQGCKRMHAGEATEKEINIFCSLQAADERSRAFEESQKALFNFSH